MKSKRSGGTTILLVTVLLALLVGIGTRVRPAPPAHSEAGHDHGEEVGDKTAQVDADKDQGGGKPNSPKMAQMQKMMEQESRQRKDAMKQMAAARAKQIPKTLDPTQIDVSAAYWGVNSDGKQGIHRWDAKIEEAKKNMAKQAPPPIAVSK